MRRWAAWLLLGWAAALLAGGCARGRGMGPLPMYVFVEGTPPGGSWEPALPGGRRPPVAFFVPSWYRIRGDGSLEERPDPGLAELARRVQAGLLPSFQVGEDAALLVNPAARSRAVANVLAAVAGKGYAGVNLRLEGAADPEAVAALAAELGERVRAEGYRFTLTAAPGQVRPEAVRRADAVLLVLHRRERPRPGPVLPREQVEEEVRAAVRAAGAPGQVVPVVAPVALDWTLGTTAPPRLLSAGEVRTLAGRARVLRARDGSPHFVYEEEGWRHEVWFEDGRSLALKVRALRGQGVGGVGVWHLGLMDGELWRALSRGAG